MSYLEKGFDLKVESISGEPGINFATCAAKLKQPLCHYKRSTVLNETNPERNPGTLELCKPLNPFLNLTEKMTGHEEWRFLTGLETITVNDGPKPLVYALIPKKYADSVSKPRLYAMLNSLASNEDIKKHILETHGYKAVDKDGNCAGLVQFIIDDYGANEMGVDWQFFEELNGEKPKVHKFVLLGAADNNSLTPDGVKHVIENADNQRARTALRKALLASETREYHLANGKPRYLFSLHNRLAEDFPGEVAVLQEALNGSISLDQSDDPKDEVFEAMRNREITVPGDGEPLSDFMLSKACPQQVSEASHHKFNSGKQTFFDDREYGPQVEPEVVNEAIERRDLLDYNSPFRVKPKPVSKFARA